VRERWIHLNRNAPLRLLQRLLQVYENPDKIRSKHAVDVEEVCVTAEARRLDAEEFRALDVRADEQAAGLTKSSTRPAGCLSTRVITSRSAA